MSNYLKVIAEILKFQIAEHNKYAKPIKDFTELTALQLVEQHASAKSTAFVLSNTLYMFTHGNSFGLTKEDIIEIAKLVPELKDKLAMYYRSSYSTNNKFSEDQIKQLINS